MNEQTWNALQQHGVVPGTTEIRLDFSYTALSRDAALALQALLREETGYDVEVRSNGSLFRRRWTIEGRTQPTALSADILDQWVEWMVTVGARTECDFDGWGAEA